LHTDTPTDPLDDHIQYILKTETVISPRRKQVLWERIEQEAAEQVILVPYAEPPAAVVPRRAGLGAVVYRVSYWVARLLTDDQCYHRAAINRRASYQGHALMGYGAGDMVLAFTSLNLLHAGLQ